MDTRLVVDLTEDDLKKAIVEYLSRELVGVEVSVYKKGIVVEVDIIEIDGAEYSSTFERFTVVVRARPGVTTD